MKLYIVIHIIYLCEKLDSVFFLRKNTKFFDTKTYLKSQISAYFRYFFFLQADGFLSNRSLTPSHFHTYNCNFTLFQSSMAIDAHRKKFRWPSMGQRWAIDGPSMGLNGVSVRGTNFFLSQFQIVIEIGEKLVNRSGQAHIATDPFCLQG